ncbi:probable BOI-related E3 ubiquitin-protein ligase 3 [Cornus florida]|uniref:probable BOI-related E3 ubiquitin-protein ligase 3 n=1 Tax=Cornus florida TaxID=4283 RepID=UPI002897E4F2|nr:probable BOI-related E3 ubiquitin-protein ligase 3 [Cornus florida]
MAVEARHLNLFPPPQLIANSELMSAIEGYSAPIGYGMPPLSGTTTETHLPMYGSAITESVPAKVTATKAESGLTYNLPISRKRPRDSINPYQNLNQNYNNRSGSYTFLGEDISLQIQLQQLEIDRFIAQHTEKVRLEIEERRKRYSRKIMAAVEEGIMKKLRAKEEEIEKIGRLNWALEEKVKSLCVENQIWRELAQSNEATANALRSNLEQVLAQVEVDDHHHHHNRGAGLDEAAAALADDAQSCCDSNRGVNDGDDEEDRMCTLAGNGGERKVVNDKRDCDGANSGGRRWCRSCGKEESCVLLLPCRHLCLCTVCGSSVHTCPICKSNKNASVHVNLSS